MNYSARATSFNGQVMSVKDKGNFTQMEKSIYDNRLYLQLKHKGEIYYYDLLSQLTIGVLSESSSTLTKTIVLKLNSLDFRECSPMHNLFFQNRIDDMKRVVGHEIICMIDENANFVSILNFNQLKASLKSTGIQEVAMVDRFNSNPLFLALLSSFFTPLHERKQQSFLYPNLHIRIHQKGNIDDKSKNTYTTELESSSIEVDRDVLEQQLMISNIDSGSSFNFSSNLEIKKRKSGHVPYQINYTYNERIANDLDFYASVGLVYKKEKEKLFSKLHTLFRTAVSACW